jgi:hypothetical protein
MPTGWMNFWKQVDDVVASSIEHDDIGVAMSLCLCDFNADLRAIILPSDGARKRNKDTDNFLSRRRRNP